MTKLQASQLPGFAENLGYGDPGLAYSMLLAADAAGGAWLWHVEPAHGWIFTIAK